MRHLDSYVARNVFMATVVVVIVIVGLDAIFTLVDELDQLKGDYQFIQALEFMALRLPRRAYEYMPMACLIGCLAGLGTMAANSELTVMRAAGISVMRITLSVLKPMALLMVISLLLAQFAVPTLERIAQSQKAVAQGKDDSLSNKGKGYWHREGNDFMRFNAVEPGGVLHGITLYEFDVDAELQRVRTAERAIYQRSHWQMENVNDVLIFADSSQVHHYDSIRWDTELSPETLSVVMIEPRDMSITNLYGYTQYLQKQGLNADNYLLSFWRKVTQPLGTFALVILGISFIFGPLRSVTPGYRIFSGILVGLVYKYAEEMLAPASIVFGFAPIWASIIPIAGCIVAGTLMMRKAG
ncbi:MAG: LPS export ABC transporter permease LptG [Oceanospirillaceae bacterium]|uniref:LPS export ABC transporter permease LptG n=1 Tax=unclassified Thalassolituus TaxID=2624967 RepID=UPI000C38225E|nr:MULTISPECIES: LPS export ABC transporter permease LptG [unclassified Thalassolituus]MAX99441.1 LPS export ABC transporter permease LptG [Oceanospirillaceae bacterium]MBL36432.1 LPS export ABC transporter permease LptG [Oceanospirillaceae bacterium]MBS54679.1 LPS export ABC transporter permease LptG [Oceanospirillaceae bacterium]